MRRTKRERRADRKARHEVPSCLDRVDPRDREVLSFEAAADELGCTVEELFCWMIDSGGIEPVGDGNWAVTDFGEASGMLVPLH